MKYIQIITCTGSGSTADEAIEITLKRHGAWVNASERNATANIKQVSTAITNGIGSEGSWYTYVLTLLVAFASEEGVAL